MSGSARHLTVAGELAGEYVVDEELADGRLVIRPDTTAQAIRRRVGGEPVSAGEFDAFLGEHQQQMLPPDDEG